MLSKLIGAQILNMSDGCIEVKKNDEVFKLEIISNYGGCCGFADFTANLLYSPNDLHNPVITNVKIEDDIAEYDDSSIVTFFGESKPLATIESHCGSGSGWQYGATVSLRCRALSIDEILSSW